MVKVILPDEFRCQLFKQVIAELTGIVCVYISRKITEINMHMTICKRTRERNIRLEKLIAREEAALSVHVDKLDRFAAN